jgi:hypothetical protein
MERNSLLKNAVFWDMPTQCEDCKTRSFGHVPPKRWFLQEPTLRRHIPEDTILYYSCRENANSCIIQFSPQFV